MKFKALLIAVILTMTFCASKGGQHYAEGGNFLRQQFKEPFEKVIFIWPTMDFISFTSQIEDGIDVPYDVMLKHILSRGLKLENCIAIYHNHPIPTSFTEPDKVAYWYFVSKGFRGIFGIYYPASSTIRYFLPSISLLNQEINNVWYTF